MGWRKVGLGGPRQPNWAQVHAGQIPFCYFSFLFVFFLFKFQILPKFKFPDWLTSLFSDHIFNLNIPRQDSFIYEFILYVIIFLSPLPFLNPNSNLCFNPISNSFFFIFLTMFLLYYMHTQNSNMMHVLFFIICFNSSLLIIGMLFS